jgi:hypothetical protein
MVALACVPFVAAVGQDQEGSLVFIVGPRIGVSYMFERTDNEFGELVSDIYEPRDYYPVNTQFGLVFEQRVLLGQTNSHFAFQEMILVAGLEQSIALPIASLIVGYRDASGFEVGAGPMFSFAGMGVVVAVGWTIQSKGVYVPVDLAVSLPSPARPMAMSMTTGFNFVRNREPRRPRY